MRRVFAFLGAAIVALAIAAPAHAQEGESIVAYDVAMTVAPDGLLTVHEDITYDFGSTERHGIVRDLVEREVYVTKADSDRLYQVDVGTITADGETAQASVETEGNYRRVRIGDPDRTITGVHQYGIDYTVEGALTGFPDHDELFWDAIGNQSNVPIANAMVEVTMPAPITKVACFSGVQGAHLACDSAQKTENSAQFFQKNLSSNQGVTVVVAVPAGTIQPPPAPVVEKHRTADDAFARGAPTRSCPRAAWPCSGSAACCSSSGARAVIAGTAGRPSTRRWATPRAPKSRCRSCTGGRDRSSSSRPTACGPARSECSPTRTPTCSTSPRRSSTSRCAATSPSWSSRPRASCTAATTTSCTR